MSPEVDEPLLAVGPGRYSTVHEEVARNGLVYGGIEDLDLLPVSASRAKRRLIGDGMYRTPSIANGVASNNEREGKSLRSLQSSVSKVQAISSFATLARLV